MLSYINDEAYTYEEWNSYDLSLTLSGSQLLSIAGTGDCSDARC